MVFLWRFTVKCAVRTLLAFLMLTVVLLRKFDKIFDRYFVAGLYPYV